MTRFSATGLDLSRVDQSTLFPTLSFETLREARLTELKTRMAEAGIVWDIDALRSTPEAKLQETSAYRELLTRQALYDAQKDVLLAFATGEFLDRLGDQHATARLEGESDERYRARIQLAPEAFSNAGTLGGYIYHAVSVSTDVRDVGVTVTGRGTPDVAIEVTILSAQGDGTPSSELLRSVHNVLTADNVALMGEVVSIRAVKIVNYSVKAKLIIPPGPDHATLKAQAEASLVAVADSYKAVGGDIPANVLSKALYVPGVHQVILEQPSDFVALRFQAGHMISHQVTTETKKRG